MKRRFLYFLCFIVLLQGCKSAEEFSGFSYDPEGVAVTTDKEIQPQHKRTIGIGEDGIWVSNEFAGARLSNFYKVSDTLYQVVIKPENYPVNNSPWYAFKAWAEEDTTVWFKLTYKHGGHRYYPNISTNGTDWHRLDAKNYVVNEQQGVALLHLTLGPEPIWISAQELHTATEFYSWADSLAQKPYVNQYTAGYSHQKRPIQRITITEVPERDSRGVVIIIGRQHPPEVTGNIACITFIEALASNSELARRFREQFEVIAYPMANPDGVANGHWRHNAGGVDLNRDWKNFNQPETAAIYDDLLKQLKDDPNRTVYYGIDFHSTGQNIFYPIKRKVETFPDDFTYRWIDAIKQAFPDVYFAVEPFSTRAPIAKNWIFHSFGADAVTYEVSDSADREKLKNVAREAAQLMMKQLLTVQNHIQKK